VIWVYAIVALAVAGGAAAGVWKYNSAIEEATELRGKLESSEKNAARHKANAEAQEKELARHQRLAADRERARIVVQKERDDARAQIEDLRRTDPVARDWLDQSLPPAVVARLRFGPGAGGPAADPAKAAGAVPKPDAGAGVLRPDKR